MAEPDKRRQKRKKKNSRFLRNAKGFAKQGIYGRGSHIDDDQYNYFINILDAMKGTPEDTEERVNMANNVFEQTNGQEIHLASNQIVSKILESLIGFVDAEHLEHYFQTFADNFRPICSDKFASHVLQKMVEIAFLRATGSAKLKTDDTDETIGESAAKRAKVQTVVSEELYNVEHEWTNEHRENCAQFVLRVSKFMLNNLEDFVWDPCANHIMRTCILCLGGVHIAKIAFEKPGADIAKNRKLYIVPEEWSEVMREFPQRLEMWPQFADFPYQDHSSALMAVICIALKVVDKNMLKHFGKKLLMNAFLRSDNDSDEKKDEKIEIHDDGDDDEAGKAMKNGESTKNAAPIKLPMVFEYQSAVMLLETILTLAGRKLFTQLYAMLFTGRIKLLALEPLTNFAVQKLLTNFKEKEDFESVFQELVEHVEELLKIGHTGVVTALSGACLRLCAKQAQLIVALQAALHVAGDKEKAKQLFACLVKLKPLEIMLEDKSSFVHMHGSLIVQHILQFNKPIFLVNCILDTPADQLVNIFNTPNGSHIADAFLKSKFIGAKSRERFIQHLENFYMDLAITKFGSRVVECCFEAAQDAQKQLIAKQLAHKSNMLKGSPFGRVIHSKLRIETFQLSATQWLAALQQKNKKTVDELFKDIIN